MKRDRPSPRLARFLAASLALFACARLGAAQVAVGVVPEGISVRVPGGIGASGAPEASRTLTLPYADFARNLTFQINQFAPAPSAGASAGVAPAAAFPQSPRARLQKALQAQVADGVSRDQAAATQVVFVQALMDRETLEKVSPALYPTVSEKLAGLAAAAQNEASRAEIGHYADELKNLLGVSLGGDARAFDRFFDGTGNRRSLQEKTPTAAYADGAPGKGKIRMPLKPSTTREPKGAPAVDQRRDDSAPPDGIARYRELLSEERSIRYDLSLKSPINLNGSAADEIKESMFLALEKTVADRRALESEYPHIAYDAASPAAQAWARLRGRAPQQAVDAPPEAIARYRSLISDLKLSDDAKFADFRKMITEITALQTQYPGIAYASAGFLARAWARLTGRAPASNGAEPDAPLPEQPRPEAKPEAAAIPPAEIARYRALFADLQQVSEGSSMREVRATVRAMADLEARYPNIAYESKGPVGRAVARLTGVSK